MTTSDGSRQEAGCFGRCPNAVLEAYWHRESSDHEVTGPLGRRTIAPFMRRRCRYEPWKHAQRAAFWTWLRSRECQSLFGIGAGHGLVHGRYFADAGPKSVCTDLRPRWSSLSSTRARSRTNGISWLGLGLDLGIGGSSMRLRDELPY